MPNAQAHLVPAFELLSIPDIQTRLPWLAEQKIQASFLLGTVSPDARVICNIPRETTHFFDIPPRESKSIPLAMFEQHPGLSDATALTPSHAAFVAGYITHLILDFVWLEKVVMPGLFIEGQTWGTTHPNWKLYSILMTYLEYQAAYELSGEMVQTLSTAVPEGEWLPFITDACLIRWRDRVLGLIGQSGARLISQYFAISNDMTSDEMEAIVTSEQEMEKIVYPFVPRKWLEVFQRQTLKRSQAFILDYLSNER